MNVEEAEIENRLIYESTKNCLRVEQEVCIWRIIDHGPVTYLQVFLMVIFRLRGDALSPAGACFPSRGLGSFIDNRGLGHASGEMTRLF